MTAKFRREDLPVEKEGAYVTVYQRPGEAPFIDINFFEGNRTVPEAIRRQRTLTKAVRLAKTWRAEEPAPGSKSRRSESKQAVLAADLERYIDEHLRHYSQRPRMWGDPSAIEASCFLLLEMYLRFVRADGDWRDIAPSGDAFQTFARKRLPKRPGPMGLAQWFTDKQYGAKETRQFENEDNLHHWAGVQIAEFFIAWKAELKKDTREVSASLRWHVEYAIERLAELVEEDPEANVLRNILNVLHRGLEGAPAGLTGVNARCPICGCSADQSHTMVYAFRHG